MNGIDKTLAKIKNEVDAMLGQQKPKISPEQAELLAQKIAQQKMKEMGITPKQPLTDDTLSFGETANKMVEQEILRTNTHRLKQEIAAQEKKSAKLDKELAKEEKRSAKLSKNIGIAKQKEARRVLADMKKTSKNMENRSKQTEKKLAELSKKIALAEQKATQNSKEYMKHQK